MKEEAERWLLKQPLYQIYLPAPKYIPRPNASMSLFAKPNDIHQSDLLSLPHDKFKKKMYKYALNIVDVVSRYKGSYQLNTKNTKEVALEKTRLIGMKPVDTIKQTLVEQGFSQPVREYEEKLLDVGIKVRYLYKPGELEGQIYKGERRKRSTDLIWSVDVYKIKDRYVQKHQPTLYYLDGRPKRTFIFEELQPIHDP